MFTIAKFGGACCRGSVVITSHRFDRLEKSVGDPLAATMVMYVLYEEWSFPASATAAGMMA